MSRRDPACRRFGIRVRSSSHLTHWKGGSAAREFPTRSPRSGAPLPHRGRRRHRSCGRRSLDATGAAVARLGSRIARTTHCCSSATTRIHAVTRSSSTGPCSARSATCSIRRTRASSPCSATTTCSTVTATRSSDALGISRRGGGRPRSASSCSSVSTPTRRSQPRSSNSSNGTLAASTARWRRRRAASPAVLRGLSGFAISRPAVCSRRSFARHRVQLVLSAHDHDYQRSRPIDGVTYIVTGGAAQARFTAARSFTAVSYRVRHFVEVAVFADRLVVRGIDQHRTRLRRGRLPERTSEPCAAPG